jgi:hypothetical protein
MSFLMCSMERLACILASLLFFLGYLHLQPCSGKLYGWCGSVLYILVSGVAWVVGLRSCIGVHSSCILDYVGGL